MDRITIAVAIGMGLVFALGVVFGFLAISIASRREARLGSLTQQPPNAATQGGIASHGAR